MDRRGSYHDFRVKVFLSHSTEKFLRRNLCFRSVLVSKFFLEIRGIKILMNVFCLTVPKKS